ncbi:MULTISPECIES: RidA family protein [Streptomyces]|uniref:RidA family protein n=1 Tax=Streptomyces koelreuteriae TaxID=2838015 RepID=A0ABX8FLJ0_9ACTN|nr:MULTISPECIES: RidA family protein [Streptomyces]QWB21967.1 RidA family protein [Streptomyces koelreuteriae]UUA04900.1 RidA family protein [Streptomyces koelreuteriae]UUA12523.1 RidA family protein [Streptomyces sp. CRCS-T-1]
MTTPDVYDHAIPAETYFGYAQAIRSGDLIHVSGQLAFDEAGDFHPEDDAAGQLELTYVNIDKVLAHYGVTRNQVVSQTLYAVDLVRHAEVVAKANRAYFGSHRPVATALGVTELTFPGQLVEISCVIDTKLPA